MRKIFFVLIFLIGNVNSEADKHEIQDYIEFQFTGAQEYSIRDLFIVKRSVDSQTTDNCLTELGLQSVHKLSQKEKEQFWKAIFSTIITDDKTFSKLAEFINKKPYFFNSKDHCKITVIINGSKHPIAKDFQRQFYTEVCNSLAAEGCDGAVINQINSFHRRW